MADLRGHHLMLHVVVPYSATNPSVRTRAVAWVERCSAADGVAADDFATFHGPSWQRSRTPAGTPLLLLRNAHRFSRGGREAALLRAGAPGVYDLDDGLPWDDGTLPGLGRWWKRPWPRSLIARRAASAATRVIAGNEVLADWAATICRDVVVVPTCVEPTDYAQKPGYELQDPPVLGWLGSPATEPYLVSIAGTLAEVHRRTGAVVEMMSAAGDVPEPLRGFTRRVSWSLDAAVAAPATWDLGLMPLADGPYERAKCGYKLLQYAAAGLPFAASPVGVNEAMIRAGDGFAARTPDDWTEVLIAALAEPADRRAARGAAARALAHDYSYASWEAVWRAAVGLSGGRP